MKITIRRAALLALAASAACLFAIPSQALAGPADTVSQVKDVDPAGDAQVSNLVSMGGNVYFSAQVGGEKRLWRSDGTSAGTFPVSPAYAVGVSDVTRVGDKIFYRAADEFSGDNHGLELGVTDGTLASTKLIDVRPGVESSSPTDITNVGGVAFFSAYNAANGNELWKSDGTEAGTTLVKDINPPGNAVPSEITDVGGEVYFSADDGSHGFELWKSDGTSAGTTMVGDLYTGAGNSSIPSEITDVGGEAFFAAITPATGWELFASDGSSIHAIEVVPGPGYSNPRLITDLNGTAIFFADDGTHGLEPYKSDGETATLIKDIDPAGDSIPFNAEAAAVGDEVFFTASRPAEGQELWKTDGTGAGTDLVKDINPTGSSDPSSLRDVGGYLYFGADEGTGINGEVEPWVSDGTAAGTTKFGNVNPVGNGYPSEFTAGPGGSVLFSAYDGSTGVELWKGTDTTAPTTSITSGPAEGSTVGADSVDFGLGADEHPVTFACKLDGAAFAACTSPAGFDGLAPGAHTFSVRATDAAGNVGNTVTRHFTTADVTPPELTLLGPKKQDSFKRVVVSAYCDEICDFAATGSIVVPKVKKGKKKAKGTKTYALGPASSTDVPAGTSTALTLKVKGKAAQKAVRKALTKKPSKATATVTATDQAGNESAPEKYRVTVTK